MMKPYPQGQNGGGDSLFIFISKLTGFIPDQFGDNNRQLCVKHIYLLLNLLYKNMFSNLNIIRIGYTTIFLRA